MTSYTVAFLSPEPVTMNLSSAEMSQQRTEDDSLDWWRNRDIHESNWSILFLKKKKKTNPNFAA